MNCPYCEEAIKSGATVCKTCRRDIALVVSLKAANEALEKKVEALEAELAAREPIATPTIAAAAPAEPPPPATVAARALRVVEFLLAYAVLPIAVLIGVHYLLIVRLDAKLLWLRAASILLPMAFGWVLESRMHPRWFAVLALGIVVGLASVLGMSTVVYFTDGDPILPRSVVDWREMLEYATSIALAYLLGSLVGFAAHPPKSADGRRAGGVAMLASFIAHHLSGDAAGKTLEERIQHLVKLINAGISAATAIGAVYTGFKNIL